MKLLKCFLYAAVLIGQAQAEVVELDGTGITFVAPDEFEPLTQEYIDLKWPRKNAPRFVIGNERGTTTIAYDIRSQDLTGKDLEQLRASIEQGLGSVIPGLQWIENAVIEQGGTNWVYIEMTSSAIDTDIYNIMMLGAFKDKTVIFNFNSTKEDFPKYEETLRRSLKSIRLP